MIHSFRDPGGFVFQKSGRIFRCVLPAARPDFEAFLASPFRGRHSADLVSSRILSGTEARDAAAGIAVPDAALLVEHGAVPFPSYPFEWPPEMLHCAAALTLRLAAAAIPSGFALKDATPSNVMFAGPRPVFVDMLSFERRDPRESLWRPYAQFVRTFLYPLLAETRLGLEARDLLFAHCDGWEPERMARATPGWRLLLPPFLNLAAIPALLARGESNGARAFYTGKKARTQDEAAWLLGALFRRLGRQLARLDPPERSRTAVSRYEDDGHHYRPAELAEKEAFVAAALDRERPAAVLDAGSNTGRFSEIAARRGARVVAIDRDSASAGMLWRRAASAGLDILPLVVDLARPTPAAGWENRETQSFLDRARGRFDCVLMLALIHHLIVTERVPLERILDLAAGLTSRTALIEYVDRSDPQFQRIARGRDALHAGFTRASFEGAAANRFDMVESRPLTPTRILYHLRRKA